MSIAYGAAKPHRFVPRHRRHHAHRTHRRRAQAQPHRVHHLQPRNGGALRPQDQPVARPWSRPAISHTTKATARPAPAKATLDSDQNVMRARDRRAHVGCHRLHHGRPHPHGPAHRRLHGRGQREFQPPAGQRPEEELRRCSPATSRLRRRRGAWIPPTTTAPSTTRAASPCGRAPTASRPTSSMWTAKSARCRPTATWSPTCGRSPRTSPEKPGPEPAGESRPPRPHRGARAAPGLYRRKPPGASIPAGWS